MHPRTISCKNISVFIVLKKLKFKLKRVTIKFQPKTLQHLKYQLGEKFKT